MKEKKTRSRLLRALQLALGAMVLVSAFNVGRILWGYRQSAGAYDTIRQSVAAPAPSSAPSSPGAQAPARPAVDMELLTRQYPDAVGWRTARARPSTIP